MAQKVSPTTAFLQGVGERIRHYRLKRGITLEQLGDDVGLDKGNMHRIEAGKNVTLLTLLKIALFLDVEPVKFLNTDVNVTLKDAENMISRKQKAKSKPKPKAKKKAAKKKR